jgi:hypothetical protein
MIEAFINNALLQWRLAQITDEELIVLISSKGNVWGK